MKDDNSIEVGGEPTPAPLSPEGKEKRHAEYQAAYRLKNGRTPESTARAHSQNQDDAFAQLPAAEQATIPLEQEEACTKAQWFIDNVKTIPHPDDAYLIVKEFLATYQPDHGWLNPVSPADPNYNLYGKQTRLTGLYRIYSSFLREVLLFCEHNPAGFANRYFPGHDLFVHENNIATLGSEYLCRGHHIICGVRPPSSLEGKTWEAFDMEMCWFSLKWNKGVFRW